MGGWTSANRVLSALGAQEQIYFFKLWLDGQVQICFFILWLGRQMQIYFLKQ